MKRLVLRCLLLMLMALMMDRLALARYPDRSITFIDAYPPGGALDIIARSLALKMTKDFGQQVFVENRAGAGGMIGTEAVVRARPNGYTIGLANAGALAIDKSLYKKMLYRPLKDLAPVSLVGEQENVVVVHPSLPVKSIRGLIALAKKEPGKILMGSGNRGTGSDLAGQMFMSMTHTKMLEVPYKGNGPAVVALLAGQTEVMFPTVITVKPYIETGQLRALAVTTAEPLSALPGVPTVAQAGVPGYESGIWFGVIAPAHTPEPIIHRLNAEIGKVINAPAFKRSFTERGLGIMSSSPETFRKRIEATTVKYAKVLKAAGIKPQ